MDRHNGAASRRDKGWTEMVLRKLRIRVGQTMQMFRLKLVCFLMRMVVKFWPHSEIKTCANRHTLRAVIGHTEYTLIVRNTTQVDAYSREECYQMLRWVRRMENRSGWKCPEPDYFTELSLSGEWNQPQRIGDK